MDDEEPQKDWETLLAIQRHSQHNSRRADSAVEAGSGALWAIDAGAVGSRTVKYGEQQIFVTRQSCSLPHGYPPSQGILVQCHQAVENGGEHFEALGGKDLIEARLDRKTDVPRFAPASDRGDQGGTVDDSVGVRERNMVGHLSLLPALPPCAAYCDSFATVRLQLGLWQDGSGQAMAMAIEKFDYRFLEIGVAHAE
jgi:hypothetical protein